MATKNKTKKEITKSSESEEKQVVQKIEDQKAESLAKDLKKEEIKEIVEETVEEVLKKESDKKDDVSSTEDVVPSTTAVEDDKNLKEEVPTSVKMPSVTPENTSEQPTQENEPVVPSGPAAPQESMTPAQHEALTSPSPSAPIFSHPLGGTMDTVMTPQAKKSSSLTVFLFFLFLGIVTGGIFLWFATNHGMLPLPKMSLPTVFKPTATPTIPPTPTVVQTQVNKSKYTIEVLNGSGVSGAAAKAKDVLSTAGYNVSGTDNADTSNFTKTVIEAKSSVDTAYLAELMKTLGTSYDVSQSTSILSDSASTDVIVTIGSSTK